MNSSQLKENLIRKINKINDETILEEIAQIVDFQIDDSVYETSLEDRKAISEAREEVSFGKTISDKEVKKEIRKWLNK